jgi:hypothetical protein
MVTTSLTELTKKEFVSNGMAGDYDNAYVYVITDEEMCLVINMTPAITSEDIDTRLYTGESLITGTLEADVTGTTASLTNVKARDMAYMNGTW